MANGKSALDINETSLKEYNQIAKSLLASVSWIPKDDTQPTQPQGTGFIPISAARAKAQEIKLAELIKNFGNSDGEFPSDISHSVLSALRQGIRIGCYVSQQYARSSGLEQLAKANSNNELPMAKQAEFKSKIIMAAAVRVFVAAYYISWKLSRTEADKLTSSTVTCPGLPEINLMDVSRAMTCSLFYLGCFLGDSSIVRTELDLVKATIAYCETLMAEILKQKDSLEFTEAFTGVHYKLQNEDFLIKGFEIDTSGTTSSIEFSRTSFEELVGNEIAKHLSKRLVERGIAYKPKERRNVFFGLNLFANQRLGSGTTGTGKTILARAIITAFTDRCDWVGIPFLALLMPNLVSELQGKSGKDADLFFDKLFNHNMFVYAVADDADTKFRCRGNQRSSEGSDLVVETTLTRTEGPGATWDGGRVLDFFSNNPDVMDPAILSRCVSKFAIDGAQNARAFYYFDYLAQKSLCDIDPNFINMTDPVGYDHLTAQAKLASLSDAYSDYREPKEALVKEVLQRVSKSFDLKSHEFFAEFYREVQIKFPIFNLRDLRNINSAINERMGDFDLPADWNDNPETFYRQPYDRQREMVLSLMRENMKGLSYHQVRLQEAIRYLDEMVRISERVKRREIEQEAQHIKLRNEAISLAETM